MTARAPGSSPLTRGKHEHTRELGVLVGLIPAHAGKTMKKADAEALKQAHPRSRGENSDPAYGRALSMGSSPLTRGKQLPSPRTHQHDGLIPAHAGKTVRFWAAGCECRAHPRSRGENRSGTACGSPARGSSPLTRGKLGRDNPGRAIRGLIPAHAGKTGALYMIDRAGEAHPRSRGENSLGC